MALKDMKPKMYCTPRDVREWHEELTDTVISDNRLEFYIVRASNIVKMHLSKVYSESEWAASHWTGIPLPDFDNSGSAFLYGASAGASACTEMFKITCASSTFSVSSNRRGSLGSGSFTASFISTNIISIPADAWSETPDSGDKHYISTYDICDAIVTVTSMLAAGLVLRSKYTEQVPNSSSIGESLENDAMSNLKDMIDPNNPKGIVFGAGARVSGDIEPIAYPWEINEKGIDVTDYYPNRADNEGETNLEKT